MSVYRRAAALGLTLGMMTFGPDRAAAEDAWNPFREKEPKATSKRVLPPTDPGPASLPPMGGVGTKPWQRGPQGDPQASDASPGFAASRPGGQPPPAVVDESARGVERGDLTPVLAGGGSGLPLDLWQGIDGKTLETLVASLEMPPRSPALRDLWKRLWTTSAAPPTAGATPGHVEALHREILYRSGFVNELGQRKSRGGDTGGDVLLDALSTRFAIAAGDRQAGCERARVLTRPDAQLPKPLQVEMHLLSGYCAAAEGNVAAAGLAADLVRADAQDQSLALSALDAVSGGEPLAGPLPKRVSLMDYRYLELAKSKPTPDLMERAEPALLALLAGSGGADGSGTDVPAEVRVQAAERAAKIAVYDAANLADTYRAQTFEAALMADPLSARIDPALRRALLFKATEGERTPQKKTRLARALLDDSRRAGLQLVTAGLLARPMESVTPAQEIGWFAETAIEINLAAGRYEQARAWVTFSERDRGGLEPWMALIDLADPKWPGARGTALPAIERVALRGRMQPDLLHRLATVLDALDYQVPIPLWEAASRTPQPSTGHLPETGVLTQLQAAAKQKEFARTVLLVMKTLGPHGADGAHLIALGDSIRALRRAGLEADARRLALEAIFAAWPRMAGT